MGQGQSVAPRPRSHEELVKELANRFALKCFSPLELYCLKDNFRSLADSTREQYHPSVGGGDGSTADKDNDDGEHSGDELGHGNDNAKEKDGGDGVVRRARLVRYLKEDTLARFLELPDALGVSPVVFQMVSFLAAFPFLSEAPAVLGLEQLVIVVTLLTDRYRRVLANGAADRNTLLFRSLAVHDRKLFAGDAPRQGGSGPADGATAAGATRTETTAPGNPSDAGSSTLGFAVDCAVDDGDEDSVDHLTLDDLADDDLAAAALEAFDYVDPSTRARSAAPRRPPGVTLHGARIPADNFRKLLLLLVLVAPLDAQERLSMHAGRVTGAALASLRASAECILATFLDVETSPGIAFAHFEAVLPVCFPYLFNGFGALFEHFLFSKNLDLSRAKPAPGGGDSSSNTAALATAASTEAAASAGAAAPAPPLLLRETDNTILDLNLLSQLSFFLPGSSLFHRLRLLYAGGNDGFSLGSFETKVFNWRAPSILLVKGTRISDAARGGQEATFAAALPPRRLPHGNGRAAKQPGGDHDDDDDDDDETLIFGAYVSQPWRLTNRECFGDSDAVLFQLSPVHDVFGASALRRDYVAFVKPTAANNHAGGIGFGCPLPTTTAAKAQQNRLGGGPGGGAAAMEGVLPLGPLSLMIDANLEYGVLTHEWSEHGGGGGGGGTFHTSVARAFGFQDRFAIEALEVWGCGGDAEARVQAERWAWEAREAEARRRINLGTGDIEADRALLEMAGLIGGSRSGGSMG